MSNTSVRNPFKKFQKIEKTQIYAIFQALASLTGATEEAEIFTEDRQDMWPGYACKKNLNSIILHTINPRRNL